MPKLIRTVKGATRSTRPVAVPLPIEVFDAVVGLSETEHRSLGSQALILIEEALKARKILNV